MTCLSKWNKRNTEFSTHRTKSIGLQMFNNSHLHYGISHIASSVINWHRYDSNLYVNLHNTGTDTNSYNET